MTERIPAGFLDGYAIRVQARRRYGRTTFTWLQARKAGSEQWVDLGDPWPCVTPKREEIHKAVLLHVYNVQD